MWKALLGLLAVAVFAATIGFGIYAGAHSFTVPIPKPEQQDCLKAAHEAGKVNPQCPSRETVWERGMRDPVAYYTLWITWFTGVLTILGLAQWFLTYRQINLAREEFLASHRPKIRVRAVGFDAALTNKGQFAISFTCVNIGDSPCTITRASYIFTVAEKPYPTRKKKLDVVEHPKPIHLAAGQPVVFKSRIVSSDELTSLGGDWDAWGMIEYRDSSDVLRITGFWRRFSGSDSTFRTIDDPDFNYEY
jgi:hypothetical protein